MKINVQLKMLIIFLTAAVFSCYAQDINQTLGTIPGGKILTIKYRVEVKSPYSVSTVSNQATVSGTSFTSLLTDDPDAPGSTDPTETEIVDEPLPVELVSFESAVRQNNIELSWNTATEINNYGFDVERKNKSLKEESNNEEWQKIGFIKGSGNSSSPKVYSYVDKHLNQGSFSYRLKQLDSDGKYKYSNEIEVLMNNVPTEYTLTQNYPNPFNPTTKIEYTLPADSRVRLTIYNLLGERVITLVDEVKTTGYYDASWNAVNIASGVYFYTLETSSVDGKENFNTVRKMILIK